MNLISENMGKLFKSFHRRAANDRQAPAVTLNLRGTQQIFRIRGNSNDTQKRQLLVALNSEDVVLKLRNLALTISYMDDKCFHIVFRTL